MKVEGRTFKVLPSHILKEKTEGTSEIEAREAARREPQFSKKKEHRRERGLCFRLKETGEEIEEDGVLPNKFRATNTSPR